MIVLTHCYPTKDDPTSGIWLHRAFGGFLDVVRIGKWDFLSPKTYLRTYKKDLIACFVIPAGLIALLSAKSYILYCLGRDCFWIERHGWFAWLCEPIFKRAKTVVYHSERVRQCISSAYGDKYYGRIIPTPVSAKEFHPKEDGQYD